MRNRLQAAGQSSCAQQLQKTTSMPSFIETAASSRSSISYGEEEYRNRAVRWIFNYCERVSRDTQHLAVANIARLPRKVFPFTEDNYEMLSIALLLLACKVNEARPPKIGELLERSRRRLTRADILEAEERVLEALDYNVARESTIYSRVHNILGFIYADQMQECDKLLRMVLTHREIFQFGEEVLSYATVYLVKPQFVRDMQLREQARVKILAVHMYKLYHDARKRYHQLKENRPQ